VLAGARGAEIPVGHPRAAQQGDLQHPIKRNGDLAEEVLAEHVRCHQKIVNDQQRDRQHRRRANDVHQVRQRGETPFRLVEMEYKVDKSGIDDEGRQEREQRLAPLHQAGFFETDIEADDHGGRGHQQIVCDDQCFARIVEERKHSVTSIAGPPDVPAFSIPGFTSRRYPLFGALQTDAIDANPARSSPRPAYARFASFGAVWSRRSLQREGGRRGPGFLNRPLDSRLRGKEREFG
jgi:hypothetical protein